jgi:hypothetical protein
MEDAKPSQEPGTLSEQELEALKTEAGKKTKKRGSPVVNSDKVRDMDEPDEQDLWAYREHCRGIRISAIAKEIGQADRTVYYRVKRVARWMSGKLMEDIRDIRSEHTDKLTDLYCRSVEAFENSQQPTESHESSSVNGVSTKSRTNSGNPAFLAVATRILADIRTMWGANATISNVDNAELDRVAGQPREKVIRAMVTAMQAAMTKSSPN